MNRSQIAWAMAHDWFVRVSRDGKGVIVRDDMIPGNTLHITNWETLRAYAGY